MRIVMASRPIIDAIMTYTRREPKYNPIFISTNIKGVENFYRSGRRLSPTYTCIGINKKEGEFEYFGPFRRCSVMFAHRGCASTGKFDKAVGVCVYYKKYLNAGRSHCTDPPSE